jgi:ATP-dependent protease HslVU (ClpYQ) peptidase subunit
MTTVIGIQGHDYCLLVADTRISSTTEDGTPTQINTLRQDVSKIAVNGKYLIGTAGDLRAINLLTHTWQPPTCPPNLKGKKLDEHITNKIIPTLRQLFETHGYTHTQTPDQPTRAGHDSELLLAINQTIYQIDGDYAWFTDHNNTYAIGTGAPYALGALTVLPTPRNPTQARKNALKAIATAAKYDPNTGHPYHTHQQQTKPKTK